MPSDTRRERRLDRMDDPRTKAARYRANPSDAPPPAPSTSQHTGVDRAAVVETAIQQAIRAGAFDDLPGAGKPIPGLGGQHDDDWWIRRKIQTEQLTGLGPPALMLRVEDAELDERLDALARDVDVRDYLEDFNRRVVEARRQLLGGPPVVTATRDVEAEVSRWRARREERMPAPPEAARSRRRLGRPGRRAEGA
jgi:hypothetical protein